LIGLEQHEGVTAILVMPKNGLRTGFLILATRQGVVKRTALENFTNLRRTGLQAITVDSEDELAWVEAGTGEEDVLLVTTDGRSIRFAQSDVRSMGRTAAGVHGIRLREDDQVVAMGLARPDHDLLVVTERGIGKRTPIENYPLQGRYGQGVYTIKNVDKIGNIVAAAVVALDMEMVLMSAGGQVIRQPVNMVRQTGRNAQGVRLMGLNEGDSVVSMACFTAQPIGSAATVDEVAEPQEEATLEAIEPDDADLDESEIEEVGDAVEDVDAE